MSHSDMMHAMNSSGHGSHMDHSNHMDHLNMDHGNMNHEAMGSMDHSNHQTSGGDHSMHGMSVSIKFPTKL